MPIYEFTCRDCNTRFDALVRVGGRAVTCPSCGAAQLEKRISASAPVRKAAPRPAGETCCGRDERCERPPCSGGGSCRRD